ncbi:MAG: lysylphosphatidylglycerol synthase domain-containing protein [Thermoleophilia bacterium]
MPWLTPRRVVAGAALVALLVAAGFGMAQLDLGAAVTAFTHAEPEMLAAALALYLTSQTLSGVMWGICQGAGGIRIAMGTTLGLHWITRASCELLPVGLGEALRVAIVRRHPEGAKAGTLRIAGGLAGFKAMDAAVTAGAMLVLVLALPLPGPLAGLRWPAIAVAAGIAALAVAARLGHAGRITRLLPSRVRGITGRLGEGARVLGDGDAARAAAVAGTLAVVARIGFLAALLLALDLPPHAAPLAYAAIVLAGIVPAAPGGAGTREVVLLPALAMAHGIPAAHALAFGMAIQATALVASLGAGALALAWLGPALVAGRRAPLEVDPDTVVPGAAASEAA